MLISDIEPVRDDCAPPAVLPPAVLPPAVLPPAVLPPAVLPPAVLPPAVLPPAVDPPLVADPLLEEPPEPARFCNVPFTSTRLPTSDEKFDALPLSRYVVPDIDELDDPAVLPVGEPAVLPVAEPAVEPVVPVVEDEEPLDIDASVRM